jgi:hypothetical protein
VLTITTPMRDAPGTTPFWVAALSGFDTAQVKAHLENVG